MISIRPVNFSNKKEKIKVCYILSYRSPNYIRTITILNALARIKYLSVSRAINTFRSALFRYVETLLKLLYIRFTKRPDFYILGFRGYEIFWPVRLITYGKPLIFDHMMSPYDSIVNERHICRKGGVLDKLIYGYEKLLLHHSDFVLTDTDLHGDYFIKLFNLPLEKIHAIPVSTDETLFLRYNHLSSRVDSKDYFHVIYYGSFLPLHGVDVILEAARILSDKPIRFILVGGKSQMVKKFHEKNVIHKLWVDYEQLPDWIDKADLCLGGPFGNTGQAKRVITGKTFQFLAMSKPTIVGIIDKEYGFKDRDNALVVPQGDGEALAGAIRWSFENQDQLSDIGRRGQMLYLRKFSNDQVKDALLNILLPDSSKKGSDND